jgi:hypothetical protein
MFVNKKTLDIVFIEHIYTDPVKGEIDPVKGKFIGVNPNLVTMFVECTGTEKNLSELPEAFAEYKQSIINQLWDAATKYQETKLNASGLTGMMYKAQQGGTKATANVNWVNSIWALYYARRAEVEILPFSYNAEWMDFSTCGNIPYSYYEAFSE